MGRRKRVQVISWVLRRAGRGRPHREGIEGKGLLAGQGGRMEEPRAVKGSVW